MQNSTISQDCTPWLKPPLFLMCVLWFIYFVNLSKKRLSEKFSTFGHNPSCFFSDVNHDNKNLSHFTDFYVLRTEKIILRTALLRIRATIVYLVKCLRKLFFEQITFVIITVFQKYVHNPFKEGLGINEKTQNPKGAEEPQLLNFLSKTLQSYPAVGKRGHCSLLM